MGFEYLGHRFHNQRPYWLQFIFDGKMFSVFNRFDISGNTTLNVLQFKTGDATRLFHSFQRIVKIQGGGPYIVRLIEKPTVTDGTLITSFNLDRRSSKTSQTAIFSDPTNVSGGTIIDEDFIATEGSGSNTSALFSSGLLERILDVNSDYVVEVENTSSNAGEVEINMIYYETTN